MGGVARGVSSRAHGYLGYPATKALDMLQIRGGIRGVSSQYDVLVGNADLEEPMRY